MKLSDRLVPKGTKTKQNKLNKILNIIALKLDVNRTKNSTYKYIYVFVPGRKRDRQKQITANY